MYYNAYSDSLKPVKPPDILSFIYELNVILSRNPNTNICS